MNSLNSLITSKTRIRLLTKFFVNPKNESYLRELAKEFNESTNAVRRELNNLSDAGYLKTGNSQNKVTYRANTEHPLYRPIQNIIRKSLGLESLVQMVLTRLGDVDRIVLIGDYARGFDSGNIEVVIIGNDLNDRFMSRMSRSIEEKIDRKVSFLVNTDYSQDGLVLYDKSNE